ncbi:MAG: cytochrome c [Sedimenticola sp.]
MKRFGILGLIFCVFPLSTALADSEGDEIYLYRSNVMEMSSGHLKALKGYVDGKLAIKNHVPGHVDSLLALNGMYQDLFPAGPQHPESEALNSIWSDPRGFQYAIENNRRKIEALQQVDPGDVDALKRAVNAVRMSCGDCHSYFRER